MAAAQLNDEVRDARHLGQQVLVVFEQSHQKLARAACPIPLHISFAAEISKGLRNVHASVQSLDQKKTDRSEFFG